MTSHNNESEPIQLATLMDLAETIPPSTKLTNRNSRGSPTCISSSDKDVDLFVSTPLRNNSKFTAWKRKKDSKIVGLKHYGLESPRHQLHSALSDEDGCCSNSYTTLGPDNIAKQPFQTTSSSRSRSFAVEKEEELVRKTVTTNPFILFYLGNLAALKVLIYYFITIEAVVSCLFTSALTVYWYRHHVNDAGWDGNSINFILVAFTLTAPMTAALTMAFTRREQALNMIADFRSFSYHLYLAHALWDWDDAIGGRYGTKIDLVEHCDAVLAQLIGIGDELSRFLSLPTTSRSRHRHTKQGRREAARTIEVAYHLLDSMATQRMTRLVMYSERLKKYGLPSGEVSRVRQYERFLSSMIEQLRMVKMYRTPQAFRSFARIFTLVLPPFYAPTFAQVARDVDSLGVGIAFGIVTALGLIALFESQQILEDPFTAYLALDGIDVREEFEVLHYAQLINTRKLVFPEAPIYPAARRAALTSQSMRRVLAKQKRKLSPTAVINGTPFQNQHCEKNRSPSNKEPVVSWTSSTTSKSPSLDKYRASDTVIEDEVEVGADDFLVKADTEGSDDDDDIDDDEEDLELGVFIEEDDRTFRESVFVHPEQIMNEPDRYCYPGNVTNRYHSRRHHMA